MNVQPKHTQRQRRTEKDLIALATRHPRFDVHCFRPGGILPADVSALTRLITAPISVRVDELASALITVAKGTNVSGQVMTNSEIKKLARSQATLST
jgi:hypothetical protein